MWQEYLQEYAKSRPECLHEWKSSPLANDHDFTRRKMNTMYFQEEHLSQVIDLRMHKWSDIRKSYRGLINQADKRSSVFACSNIDIYKSVHRSAFGIVRSNETFDIQGEWMMAGNAITVLSRLDHGGLVAAALWIIYNGCAYYASGPSLEKDVQHALIWHSLLILKDFGVNLVELGQIDGKTEKEKAIGFFKKGWGGASVPFTIVRRMR